MISDVIQYIQSNFQYTFYVYVFVSVCMYEPLHLDFNLVRRLRCLWCITSTHSRTNPPHLMTNYYCYYWSCSLWGGREKKVRMTHNDRVIYIFYTANIFQLCRSYVFLYFSSHKQKKHVCIQRYFLRCLGMITNLQSYNEPNQSKIFPHRTHITWYNTQKMREKNLILQVKCLNQNIQAY